MNLSTNSLSPELVAVLRAASRMDLATALSIGKILGRPVADDLDRLRELRYVRMVSTPRPNGPPNRLYSVTPYGTDALKDYDRVGEPVPVPTIGQRPTAHRETYMGGELRQFADRAGSMDALRYPSRVGDQLRYPEHGPTSTETPATPSVGRISKK